MSLYQNRKAASRTRITVDESVFLEGRDGRTVEDPAFRAAIAAAVAKVRTLPGVTDVTSPLESDVSHGHLCVKGRFGFEFVQRRAGEA